MESRYCSLRGDKDLDRDLFHVAALQPLLESLLLLLLLLAVLLELELPFFFSFLPFTGKRFLSFFLPPFLSFFYFF